MNSTLPLIRNKGNGWDTIIVLFWVLRLLSCHHLDVIQDVVRGTNETSNLIRQEDQVMLRWPALARRLARQSQFHCQSHKDNENETGSVWQIEFHCWSQLREGICLRGDLRDYNQISLPDQNRSSKWQPYHYAQLISPMVSIVSVDVWEKVHETYLISLLIRQEESK